ncbi:MAG: DoxX family protein [Bryobacterales bacterium]|nr:DoxX family protein [Bryobacterales bacterium]
MHPAVQAIPAARRNPWAGRVVSLLAVLFLLFDGVIKLLDLAPVADSFTRLGYATSIAPAIGILELACTLAYMVPRTAVIGAILLTGFLGGATATHLRIGDPYFFPLVVGGFVWAGLWLRDGRVRILVSPHAGPAVDT